MMPTADKYRTGQAFSVLTRSILYPGVQIKILTRGNAGTLLVDNGLAQSSKNLFHELKALPLDENTFFFRRYEFQVAPRDHGRHLMNSDLICGFITSYDKLVISRSNF